MSKRSVKSGRRRLQEVENAKIQVYEEPTERQSTLKDNLENFSDTRKSNDLSDTDIDTKRKSKDLSDTEDISDWDSLIGE